jgi:hypothetical protein
MIHKITQKNLLAISIILILCYILTLNIIKEEMIDGLVLSEMELNFKREIMNDPTKTIKRMTELDLSHQVEDIKFNSFFDILI